MTELLSVRDAIRNCRACNLRNTATTPVPWSGRTPASHLFLGMAPGKYEDQQGQPFIARAGIQLRLMIAQAGFPKDVAFANAVCCYPGRTGKGGDVRPVQSELDACRVHLKCQIALIQPRYIFLLGRTALDAFRPDLELAHTHGRPLFFDSRSWGFPTPWTQRVILWTSYHPAAALRNRKYEALLRDDFSAFWRFRRADEPWPEECAVCGKEPFHSDGWGFMTCELHAMRQGSLLP